MSTPLEIVVKGDITDLDRKMAQGASAIKKFSTDGAQSIFNLTEKLRGLESAVFTEKSRANIAAYNVQIQQTKKQIDQLSNVGKEGFDKLGNAILSTANPLTKLYSSVRVLAYAIPGIGIAGIFSLAGEAIYKAVTATELLSEKQQLLNDVYDEAAKKSSVDVAKLELLKAKLNDLNISQSDRIKYATQYNAIADAGNKLDLTQINNLDLINEKIAAQIRLIETRALAKAAEGKLGEQAQKVINAQLEVEQYEKFKDARKLTSEEIKKANQEDQREQQRNLQANRQVNSDNLAQHNSYLRGIAIGNNDALEGLKKYNSAYEKLIKEKAEFDRQAGYLLPLINTESFSTADKGIKIKPIKAVVPVFIKFKPQPGEFEFDDPEETARLISEALDKLYKGLKTGTSTLGKQDIELNPNIYFSEKSLQGLRQNLIDKLHSQGVSTADRILENGVKIKIPIEIATTKELNAALDGVKISLERQAQEINKIVANTIDNAISSLADSIGKLSAGTGNLGDLFGNLFKVLGTGIKQLGQYLVQTNTLLLLAKKVGFSNPVVGIAVGIGLEALGAIIQANVSKRQAFATGVRNFSGGRALVGERGPELVTLPSGSNVTPNAQLRAMNHFGAENFVLETMLYGQDMRILLKRADAANRRNS